MSARIQAGAAARSSDSVGDLIGFRGASGFSDPSAAALLDGGLSWRGYLFLLPEVYWNKALAANTLSVCPWRLSCDPFGAVLAVFEPVSLLGMASHLLHPTNPTSRDVIHATKRQGR